MVGIPVTILSGYLGAGKTTLINHLLTAAHGIRVTVLVNDFGAVSIDASLIASRADQTIALSNGCVCCSIQYDLAAAIDTQLRRVPAPQHILIEASGVAEPMRILRYAEHWPGLKLHAVVCVVDAETIRERASDKFVGRVVQRQIIAADLLVLNKTDMISSGGETDVANWLEDLSPGASLVRSQYGNIDPVLLLGRTYECAAALCADGGALPAARFVDAAIALTGSVEIDVLENALARAPKSIHRIKGFVIDAASGRIMLVQCVGERCSIEPWLDETTQAPQILTLIGTDSGELQSYRSQLTALIDQRRMPPHEPIRAAAEQYRSPALVDTGEIRRA